MLNQELKEGSAELLILSLLDHQPRHGYELAKLIGHLSEGVLSFYPASIYPTLYRLERRKWVKGRWVEEPGQRRRRFYRLTDRGREVLEAQRVTWKKFARAVDRITGLSSA